MITENDDGVPGDNQPDRTIQIDVTPRQLELATGAIHDWLLAEEEDGDDPTHLNELRDLDELLRGSHPRWNGQTQAFFEARALPGEDHAHLLRTLFDPKGGEQ